MDDLEFEEAPYDNYEEHVSVGRIILAKKGEALPLTTKYKRKTPSYVPVKFTVDKFLNVTTPQTSSLLKRWLT